MNPNAPHSAVSSAASSSSCSSSSSFGTNFSCSRSPNSASSAALSTSSSTMRNDTIVPVLSSSYAIIRASLAMGTPYHQGLRVQSDWENSDNSRAQLPAETTTVLGFFCASLRSAAASHRRDQQFGEHGSANAVKDLHR